LKRVYQENERKLDEARKLVIHGSQKTIESEHLNIRQHENVLRLVDPKNVLKRGYSITTVNGKTIQSNTKMTEGTIIHTKTYDFELESIITNKQTHE
jgi:exodeoxyribonuclease VII large subunit